MPCDSRLAEGQTLPQRMRQVEDALARLKRYLETGSVKVVVGRNGAVAFAGWDDRDNISDVCAYRSLASSNSWELRKAVASAEARAGVKVNPSAVAAGVHSHDGGRTFNKGH